MSRLSSLLGIMALSWVLVIVGVVIIFYGIVPLPDVMPDRTGIFVTALLKAVLSFILVAVWLLIMAKMTSWYARKKLKSGSSLGPPPKSSS